MDDNLKYIQDLMNQVALVQNKYEEIAALTGENFNIFRVLKMEAREVRTHSAFLAELLHPKGSHGMGDAFLKLFVKEVSVENLGGKEIQYNDKFALADFQPERAEVQMEYHISPKMEETGGRIDILVSSGKSKLILENKIYAADQEKQLVRYSNFEQTAPLYYLTLWANQRPTDTCKGDLEEGKHYKRISYENEILAWLEKCREKSANRPLLRETITQYIYLLKYLTHKSSNNKMENELIGLVMKSEGSFKAYESLRSLNAKQIIINNQVETQLTALANTHGLRFEYRDTEANGQVLMFGADWLRAINLGIAFSFYDNSHDFGFAKADFDQPLAEEFKVYLQAKMAESFPEYGKVHFTDNWPAWQNKEIDFEILRTIWEGRFGEKLEGVMGRLLGIVRDYPVSIK